MAIFNKAKVTPENKAFAAIDSILKLINDNSPELKLVTYQRFTNLRYPSEDDQENASLYLQAYPIDKTVFMLEQALHVLRNIKS